MKKNICKMIVVLALVMCLGFISTSEVKATEFLVDCKYNFDFQSKNISFHLVYREDKKIWYSINDRTYKSEIGSRMWTYESGFEKTFIDTIINDDGTFNQCPNLSICYDDNQLLIHPGSHWCDPSYNGSTTAVGKTVINQNIVNQEVKKEKLMCSKSFSDNVVGKNYKITLEFYKDSNENKMVRLKPSNSTSFVEAKVENGVFYEDYDYIIANDVIEKMYKDEKTCDNTPIYIGTRDNSSAYNKVMNITLDPPEDGEGGLHGQINDGDSNGSIDSNDDDSDTDINLEGVAACALIGEKSKTGKIIKKIILIIRIIIPILIVILTILDFLKVFASDDDKVYKQAWNRFIKRCVVGVVFFLIPTLLKLLFVVSDVLGIYSISADSIFCYLI